MHRVTVTQRRGAQRSRKQRAVGHDDRVLAHPVTLGIEVLYERAALGDVQHLHATADRQYRHVAGDGCTHHRQVELVVQAHHSVQRVGGGLLAVTVWLDVAAAGQQQPVELIEVVVGHLRSAGERWQQHGQTARRGHGPAIGLAAREGVAAALVGERHHPADDADERWAIVHRCA